MQLADPPTSRPLLLGSRHMVSAGHPLATLAGLRVLDAGGNAIDAGVAAGFALNVVQPDMASLGGVAPIILHHAEARMTTTFAGIGRWPALASLEAVSRAGGGRIPVGPQRWVVPAAVGAWLVALERYGTMTAAEVMQPAIELAAGGFPVHYFLRHNIATAAPRWAEFAHNREVFLARGLPEDGALLRQAALAVTLERLAVAEQGFGGSREDGIRAARDAFYKGDIAHCIDRFSREVGGFLRYADLESFAVREETAYSVPYRGHRVFGCGPWSQGPAFLMMLRIAERLDLASAGLLDRTHLLIEVVKRAMVERNLYCGDPEFVDVPMDWLLSDAHADALVRDIRSEHASDRLERPTHAGTASPDTTYVCTVDGKGNAFSVTPSDSTILVTPMVPGLGFGISDRGLQASLDPKDPNSIQPGKRPRLTPNPALMFGEDGTLAFGTPGGEVQTQAMLQFIVNHVDLGLDLQAAVEAPRFASYAFPATEDPHPSSWQSVRLEAALHGPAASLLTERGHVVEAWPAMSALAGGICAVHRERQTGVVAGAADPRRMSYAAGR